MLVVPLPNQPLSKMYKYLFLIINTNFMSDYIENIHYILLFYT